MYLECPLISVHPARCLFWCIVVYVLHLSSPNALTPAYHMSPLALTTCTHWHSHHPTGTHHMSPLALTTCPHWHSPHVPTGTHTTCPHCHSQAHHTILPTVACDPTHSRSMYVHIQCTAYYCISPFSKAPNTILVLERDHVEPLLVQVAITFTTLIIGVLDTKKVSVLVCPHPDHWYW